MLGQKDSLNVEHKFLLLLAAQESYKQVKTVDEVRSMFLGRAIAAALDSGLINDAALALNLLGDVC